MPLNESNTREGAKNSCKYIPLIITTARFFTEFSAVQVKLATWNSWSLVLKLGVWGSFKEYNSLLKETSRGYGPGLAEHRRLLISKMQRDLPGPQARLHSLNPHCQSTMQEVSTTKATLSLLRAIPREPCSRVTVRGSLLPLGLKRDVVAEIRITATGGGHLRPKNQ